jgi:hypothetical protein
VSFSADFIMQIYPVTREWDEADWLDPFIYNLIYMIIYVKKTVEA